MTDRVAERAADRVGFREAVALAFVCLEPRFDVVWASADVGTPSRAGGVGSGFCRGSEDNSVAIRGFLLTDDPLFA